jgi:hypothetical protein
MGILHRAARAFNILSLSLIYEQPVIIWFLHKERGRPAQIHRRPGAQNGFEISSVRSAHHWSQLCNGERQILNDDLRSGRPPIDHLDTKILACFKKERFSSAYSLAEAPYVSPAITLNHLHNFVSAGSYTS